MKPLFQSNFCRLTGISHLEYQTSLFETGCLWAEKRYLLPELYQPLLESSKFWSWWQVQWEIKTQEAFGVTGISPNEERLSSIDADALFEAFLDLHHLTNFKNIYPKSLKTTTI